MGFTPNAGIKNEEDLADHRHQENLIVFAKGLGLHL
jgi:hypothetical protein